MSAKYFSSATPRPLGAEASPDSHARQSVGQALQTLTVHPDIASMFRHLNIIDRAAEVARYVRRMCQ